MLLIGGLRKLGVRAVAAGFELRRILVNAAERLQSAPLAGFRIFARIHIRAAGEKIPGKLLDRTPPVNEHFRGEGLADECIARAERRQQSSLRVTNAACESDLSRPQFG